MARVLGRPTWAMTRRPCAGGALGQRGDLVVLEQHALAGGAGDEDAVQARVGQPRDVLGERVERDRAVLGERRRDRGEEPRRRHACACALVALGAHAGEPDDGHAEHRARDRLERRQQVGVVLAGDRSRGG